MEGTEVPNHERTSLGDFIASQRRAAEMSLRQLADRAGISNPYVSQIERGLRKPSAEVLNQIATALSVSAESLYVRAGLLEGADERPTATERAISTDHRLSPAQRQALIGVYRAFTGTGDQHTTEHIPTPQPDSVAQHEE